LTIGVLLVDLHLDVGVGRKRWVQKSLAAKGKRHNAVGVAVEVGLHILVVVYRWNCAKGW
jgi:hypothetical protein